MRKIIQILFIFSLGSIVFFVGYYNNANGAQDKIGRMTAVLETHGAVVEGWTWLAKEENESVYDIHTFQQLLQTIKEKANAGEWNVEKTEAGYKAEAIKKFPNYQERLVVTWTKVNTKHKTFISYEVNGTKWDPNIRKKADEIFSQKPTIYTCVRGVLNDKIEGVLLNQANEILESFDAKPIEALQERAFVSVSAYTGEWSDALIVNREKMNMQVAIRYADNKKIVVLGTPIITSEY
ncbi:YwmB family TATA-box binding protein [Microbacteriaceae bacterium 4G12]